MPKKLAVSGTKRRRIEVKPKKGLTAHAHASGVEYHQQSDDQLIKDAVQELAAGHTPGDNPALASEVHARGDNDPAWQDTWNTKLANEAGATLGNIERVKGPVL